MDYFLQNFVKMLILSMIQLLLFDINIQVLLKNLILKYSEIVKNKGKTFYQ